MEQQANDHYSAPIGILYYNVISNTCYLPSQTLFNDSTGSFSNISNDIPLLRSDRYFEVKKSKVVAVVVVVVRKQ